ncbi:MAG: putative phytanoyl-CoA dioxygenase [Rhizobium sp.]|nr:putative phytanoyl-CoA dioxygenase [Rhizobium sp.]
MDTQAALATLGVNPDAMTAQQKQDLDENGYFVIENALTPEQCKRMAAEVDRIAMLEGENAGNEVSQEPGSLRISNIFNKSDVFDELLVIKPLLSASRYLLGDFKVHGANIREPRKGHGKQPLHSDSVMYEDGTWALVNALICFDDMTLDNGPTRVVPGSHKWGPLNVPGENAADYHKRSHAQPHRWAVEGDNIADHVAESPLSGDVSRAPTDPFAPFDGEVKVTVPAGSVVVTNAHIWHSGTLKHTDERRRQLHLSYTRRDLPQQLVQRNYLTPQFNARLGEPMRYLLDVQ